MRVRAHLREVELLRLLHVVEQRLGLGRVAVGLDARERIAGVLLVALRLERFELSLRLRGVDDFAVAAARARKVERKLGLVILVADANRHGTCGGAVRAPVLGEFIEELGADGDRAPAQIVVEGGALVRVGPRAEEAVCGLQLLAQAASVLGRARVVVEFFELVGPPPDEDGVHDLEDCASDSTRQSASPYTWMMSGPNPSLSGVGM
jgi:hypothetical protein